MVMVMAIAMVMVVVIVIRTCVLLKSSCLSSLNFPNPSPNSLMALPARFNDCKLVISYIASGIAANALCAKESTTNSFNDDIESGMDATLLLLRER